MKYKTEYDSILGNITLISDGDYLCGLYIEGQNFCKKKYPDLILNDDLEIFSVVKNWLDEYFLGNNPFIDKRVLRIEGTTFQQKVWEELLNIPYGKSISYGDIAKNINNNSSRAVGTAIGHNPISIIIPCHRVVGKNSIGGYNGGLEMKKRLLEIEHIYFE